MRSSLFAFPRRLSDGTGRPRFAKGRARTVRNRRGWEERLALSLLLVHGTEELRHLVVIVAEAQGAAIGHDILAGNIGSL